MPFPSDLDLGRCIYLDEEFHRSDCFNFAQELFSPRFKLVIFEPHGERITPGGHNICNSRNEDCLV